MEQETQTQHHTPSNTHNGMSQRATKTTRMAPTVIIGTSAITRRNATNKPNYITACAAQTRQTATNKPNYITACAVQVAENTDWTLPNEFKYKQTQHEDHTKHCATDGTTINTPPQYNAEPPLTNKRRITSYAGRATEGTTTIHHRNKTPNRQ